MDGQTVLHAIGAPADVHQSINGVSNVSHASTSDVDDITGIGTRAALSELQRQQLSHDTRSVSTVCS